MNYNELLQSDENVEMVIYPKRGLMMHANDGFKIMAFTFFISVAILVGFKLEHYFFIVFGVVLLFIAGNAILKRYGNTRFVYVITDKRILFLKNNVIIKSKYFETLKSLTYENSGNNRGYIILGEPKELFAGRGISFEEDDYVLDNLENYYEVSSLIKSRLK